MLSILAGSAGIRGGLIFLPADCRIRCLYIDSHVGFRADMLRNFFDDDIFVAGAGVQKSVEKFFELRDTRHIFQRAVHFGGRADFNPNVRAEFFGNVRRDYPLWIIYGTDPDRNFDEPPKFLDEDVELEQLLAERYTLRGEVYIWPQLMKLYRLKSAQ